MKELSIEGNAYDGNYKAYTELINRLEDVKNAIKKQNYGIAMDILCKPYPEYQITTSTGFKESEDEKMRKGIIRNLEYLMDRTEGFVKDELKKRIAWLEAQGEHSNFLSKIQVGDKITRNEDGVLVNLSQLNRVAKKDEKQGKQKPAWSEEDEQMFEHIIEKATLKFSEWNCLKNDEINFLKSLHPQNKQEWTQDDIDMIDWLIRCCEKEHEELCNDRYGHQDIVSDLKRDCRKKWDWLESLKERVAPQSHWKPSEGQLECLGNAIDKAEKDYPTSD